MIPKRSSYKSISKAHLLLLSLSLILIVGCNRAIIWERALGLGVKNAMDDVVYQLKDSLAIYDMSGNRVGQLNPGMFIHDISPADFGYDAAGNLYKIMIRLDSEILLNMKKLTPPYDVYHSYDAKKD